MSLDAVKLIAEMGRMIVMESLMSLVSTDPTSAKERKEKVAAFKAVVKGTKRLKRPLAGEEVRRTSNLYLMDAKRWTDEFATLEERREAVPYSVTLDSGFADIEIDTTVGYDWRVRLVMSAPSTGSVTMILPPGCIDAWPYLEAMRGALFIDEYKDCEDDDEIVDLHKEFEWRDISPKKVTRTKAEKSPRDLARDVIALARSSHSRLKAAALITLPASKPEVLGLVNDSSHDIVMGLTASGEAIAAYEPLRVEGCFHCSVKELATLILEIQDRSNETAIVFGKSAFSESLIEQFDRLDSLLAPSVIRFSHGSWIAFADTPTTRHE